MIEKKQDKELPMPFTIEKEYDPLYKSGRREGVKQGRKQGREEGLEKGKVTIAKALLKKGVAIDVIIDVTGLDRDKIQTLQED